MKLKDMIMQADDLKPNQYNENIKTMWLTEVENIIIDEVLNRRSEVDNIDPVEYVYSNDGDVELLVPNQFSDVYLNYLFAKIDYSNSELERYNNSTMMYNSSLEAYAGYMRRYHVPKQPAVIGPF